MEPTCVKNKKFREGTFHAQKPTMKKFIMFQEKKISSSKFIKLLCSSKKERMVPRLKKVLIFSQNKVFLIFWEMELSTPKNKKFQEKTFQVQKIQKTHSEETF